MLSQQHTGHGHPATEGPGPSSGFMLTEEYAEARAAAFRLLRLGAGITKSADQSFPSFVRIPNGLLNSSNAEMAGC